MPSYNFKQVDVFTTQPFQGNPVAVVLGAEGLSSADMQRIAAWTNLSETTFVLAPTSSQADYRLRIFTPKQELPFAGHPTIGSAHAVLESGLVKPASSQWVQECAAGLLKLSLEDQAVQRRIFAQTPQAKVSQVEKSVYNTIVSALGTEFATETPPLLIDVGPVWLVVNLQRADVVHGLKPDLAAITELSQTLQMVGITVFGLTENGQSALYVRSFAPAHGVPEDPVCGSGNASVAAFLAHAGMLGLTGDSYVASQGIEMGRNGLVAVRVSKPDLTIEIGGHSVTCVEGCLRV